MERSRLGWLDGGILRPGSVVTRRLATAFLAGAVLLCGCYDPFGPVTPETPTAGSTGQGSKNYWEVPIDFGNALDSAKSDRISALLVDTVRMTDANGVATLSATPFENCLDSLLSPRFTSLLQWGMGPSVRWVPTSQDVEVGTFDYSLVRSGSVLATNTATWTVVRIGTEWKLQQWTEGTSNTGWVKLCQSQR